MVKYSLYFEITKLFEKIKVKFSKKKISALSFELGTLRFWNSFNNFKNSHEMYHMLTRSLLTKKADFSSEHMMQEMTEFGQLCQCLLGTKILR